MKISRRNFCIGAGLSLFLPKLVWAADVDFKYLTAIRTHLSANSPGPVLLHSYIVEQGSTKSDFDLTHASVAYVYDNALAGLLLLSGGYPSEARRIGEALEIAQGHDRFFTDGRLRNAYAAGIMTEPAKLAGWWNAKEARWNEDAYQAGSHAGPVAWAILLWAALGMRQPAMAAASWLARSLKADQGYTGGYHGFEPDPIKLDWRSTEQNVDLFVAFTKLGMKDEATHAKLFVDSMFIDGVFCAGATPDGHVNRMLAADAGIWPYLAGIGSRDSSVTAINRLRYENGIGFSDASKGIWLEGTAFAALAEVNTPEASSLFSVLDRNVSPEGYLYATVDPSLSTGLGTGLSLGGGEVEQQFNYYRRPSLSATAWAGFATRRHNPLSDSFYK